MTLQASIEQTLPFLRAEAEARMLDTWEIGTDEGWAYNPATGRDEQTIGSPVTLKGRLTTRSTTARDSEAGDRTVVETRRELHIPWDSPATPVNAVARCTAIHSSTDPMVLNTVVRLAGPAPAAQKTARRLEVIEVLS